MPALHRERDTTDYRDQTPDDREISLGTGTILAIFFALALICAIFFGLGYTMGRKSAAQATLVSAAVTEPAVNSSIFNNFKPSAGNPGTQSFAATKKDPEAKPDQPPKDPDGEIVTTPVSASEDASTPPHATTVTHKEIAQQTTPAPIVRQPLSPAPSPNAMPAINPNGTSIVQVAAVSHQEDADVLISALKKRGYTVFIRQEPQDKLLHVQIGPFATKKDAEAMRQHLLSDGYNAIVK
jgi:DedD protein